MKHKPTVVFMGTYPPRECGIATFNQDLRNACQQYFGDGVACKVAAMNLSTLNTHTYPSEVKWKIDQNNKKEYADLAKSINVNRFITSVVVQHEYGIYGGLDGQNILAFLETCTKPLVVTLHTVLPEPKTHMKEITQRIIERANLIVVLTESSKKIVELVYPVAIGKVQIIPHGIHPTIFESPIKAKKHLKLSNVTLLSTFGLLSRGKGIEYVIRALPQVVKQYPDILYLILGQTHPTIRRKEGEKYRAELSKLITSLHLKKHIKFYDQYLNLPNLIGFLKATDIYIATSINPNQAVSGTLSYALGTGRAVISTSFVQAREMITDDTGRLVPVKDSKAITTALLDLLSDKGRLLEMHKRAYDLTRRMLWSNVAKEYVSLLATLLIPPMNLKHLRDMTDEFGLFQFGTAHSVQKEFGYTLDDNARALIACSWLIEQDPKHKNMDILVSTYLSYMQRCQLADGRFINYMGQDKKPTVQNDKEDLSDANARAMWSLAEVMCNDLLPPKSREQAQSLFVAALPYAGTYTFLRSQAFVIKALTTVLGKLPDQRKELLKTVESLAMSLAQALKDNGSKDWYWFENTMTYNNALLPEALLLAGAALHSTEYQQLGSASLEFLIKTTFTPTMYLPIGHEHWYKRNAERSYHDQQPEDPAAMILALSTAYKILGQEKFKELARLCFSWFLGNNITRHAMYDYETGGCYDGLQPDGVNQNQGAESLISYVMSRLAMTALDS